MLNNRAYLTAGALQIPSSVSHTSSRGTSTYKMTWHAKAKNSAQSSSGSQTIALQDMESTQYTGKTMVRYLSSLV